MQAEPPAHRTDRDARLSLAGRVLAHGSASAVQLGFGVGLHLRDRDLGPKHPEQCRTDLPALSQSPVAKGLDNLEEAVHSVRREPATLELGQKALELEGG